jgi:hypothetical protein
MVIDSDSKGTSAGIHFSTASEFIPYAGIQKYFIDMQNNA